jgi:hypothetical protein
MTNPTAGVLDEVGIPGAVLGPGQSAEVTVPSLQPGTYALVCFIPGEGDGVPHFVKGMLGQLEVVAGATPPPPTADATYKVTPGKAVEGPTTLTAGRHVIKFEAAPGSEQLEPALVKLNAGTTLARLETTVDSIFQSDKPPAKGAAARVPGEVVFGGFDLLSVTEFYVAVDLKPGNYAIDAADTDNNAPPSSHKEILSIKVA